MAQNVGGRLISPETRLLSIGEKRKEVIKKEIKYKASLMFFTVIYNSGVNYQKLNSIHPLAFGCVFQ